MNSSLPEAFARCERIVRERAKNFWYGLRLTPEPKRSAMYAIYAWMREADDIADGDDTPSAPPDRATRAARLAAFRTDTDRALAGEAPSSETNADRAAMWRALAAIAPTYRLDSRDFHDMIDGQLADLGAVRMESWNDLRTQCYRVASTVGLVCVRVWGLTSAARDRGDRVRDLDRGDRVRDLAIDRGIAFQLTNILRDVREDYEAGRVYLPSVDLERHGLTIESLLAWNDAPRCKAFMAAQIERAAQHYRSSEGLEELISPECVPTLWAMTSIYRQLLDRIAGDPKAIIGANRVRLATWQKLWIGFRAKRMAAKSKPAARNLSAEVATP